MKSIFKKAVTGVMLPVLFLSGCGHNGMEVVKKSDGIVITVLAGQSTSDAGVEEMIDAALAEKFPDIKLDWECVDWGEDFDRTIRARFAAGDVPDIMIGKAQDVISYESTGNLAVIQKDIVSNISEETLKTVSVDDQVYGMPYNAFYQGVIYNRALFDQAGIEIPETREEMRQAVQQLEDHNIVPFASHFAENWSLANMTMQQMLNDVFASDSQWGNEFRLGQTGFLEDDRVRADYAENQFIYENTWEDAAAIDQYECDKRFEQGEAAMYLSGSWSMQFVESTNEQFGIFPYPNEAGDAKLIRETNMTFMKSAGTAYSQQIDDIFAYLQSDEKLMAEILEFTQSSTVQKDGKPENRTCLAKAIGDYMDTGEIMEAGTGNTQLVWTYQYDIAKEQLKWLQGSASMEDALRYANEHKAESGY